MNIDDYVDKECRKIAKMANKQLLKPGRKIYIPWPLRQPMFRYLTKEALENFCPYGPYDWYQNEIVIENESTGRYEDYSYIRPLMTEYTRFKSYLYHEEMGFEQHLQNAFLHMVKRGINHNLSEILKIQRPQHSFQEYDLTNLLVNCYALALINENKLCLTYSDLLKYFRDRPHWFVIDPCSRFMSKDCGFDLTVKLIEERLLFRTDLKTYLIWNELNSISGSSELKIEITDNTTAPQINGIAMTDEGLLVYEMLHFGEGQQPIKQWTVNENTSSKPDAFSFYGYDQNGQ